jgi:hypothetical protein
MTAKEKWLYSVEIKHAKTHARRTLTVELTEPERLSLLQYECFYPGHTGGPDGPISKSMAIGHAEKIMPVGFVFPADPEIRRIAATNVWALR